MKKKIIFFLVGFIGLLLTAELVLRLFGLGNPPLFMASPKYEYNYAPNQDVRRFGNCILINEHAMRSRPIQPADKVKVLLFGDSIINGGAATDHEALASTLLEYAFQEKYGESARVLNVSCGSWGPDNNFAFLQENGDFGAEKFVLVFSSHDYDDWMTFRPIVGNSRVYPDRKPATAVGEGINRYLLPKITHSYLKDPSVKPRIPAEDRQGRVQGWEDFRAYCAAKNIPMLVVLHPDTEEVAAGSFSEKGQLLIEWLESHEIPYVNELAEGTQTEYYRDEIHYNEEGQNFLFEELKKELL